MKLFSVIILMFFTIPSYSQSAIDFFNTGITKLAQLNYKGSLADFNRAIEMNPRLKEAFVNRGLVKEKLGDNLGALSDYTNAILIDNKLTVAYHNRGFLNKIY